jgi:hypothetical protein
MMPDRLFFTLLLVGLLWLWLILHIVWPYNRATSGRYEGRAQKFTLLERQERLH